MRRQSGSFDQVDAVGNRRKYRVEALANCPRLARQVDDQRLATNTRHLSRQDCRGNFLQGNFPHEFAKPWQQFFTNGLGCLGRDIAPRRARSAGRNDQAAILLVAHLFQNGGQLRRFVWHDSCNWCPGAGKNFRQVLSDRGTTSVFVFTTTCPVRNGNDADIRCHDVTQLSGCALEI